MTERTDVFSIRIPLEMKKQIEDMGPKKKKEIKRRIMEYVGTRTPKEQDKLLAQYKADLVNLQDEIYTNREKIEKLQTRNRVLEIQMEGYAQAIRSRKKEIGREDIEYPQKIRN